MPSIHIEREREALLRRVAALSPESRARWGTLDVGRMLAHLDLCADMALGNLSVKPAGKWVFTVFPLKHLLLHVIPFPKGAPTASDLVGRAPDSLGAARDALIAKTLRLAAGGVEGAGPVHPLFGPLSRRQWCILVYKHSDHHLRQFGV